MNTPQHHKNKTIAALLASTGGMFGLHRFYLKGNQDKWAWLHLTCLPAVLLIYFYFEQAHTFFMMLPIILSMLVGFLTCLIIGTTSDEKWDASYNKNSSHKSDTKWPMAVILVLTLGVGASALIAVIARTFDLIFTGGSFG